MVSIILQCSNLYNPTFWACNLPLVYRNKQLRDTVKAKAEEDLQAEITKQGQQKENKRSYLQYLPEK